MITTQAQQLDRCARALRTAECSLGCRDQIRVSALMAARDEIDATLRVLALGTLCIDLLGVFGIETVRTLTAGRPAVEVRK